MEKTSLQYGFTGLTLMYSVLATSYLFAVSFVPYPLSYLHKAAPILLLAAFVLRRRQALSYWVLAALLFSSIGDILLALQLENGFVLGLSAFLFGHVCYCLWFLKAIKHRQRGLLFWPFGLLVPVGAAMMAFILPETGALQAPVAIYMLVILLMSAAAMQLSHLKLTLGAASFMVSDGLIAINKFVAPVPFESLLIMSTYYLAQILLIVGIVEVANAHDSAS